MNIAQLPLDVWGHIVHEGGLSIGDVLAVHRTNGGLNRLLGHNVIWYKLAVDNYLQILKNYGVEWARRLVDTRNEDVDYFALTMKFYRKELAYMRYVKNNSNDIRKYLDAFVDDIDYLPIIYRHYSKTLPEKRDWSTQNSYIDLKENCLSLNLLIAHAFQIGFEYFKSISFPQSAQAAFEEFWFKMSLLDKNCHNYIFDREAVLQKIHRRLHREISVKQFFNGSGRIHLRQRPGKKDLLIFETEGVFLDMVVQIFRITLSTIKLKNPLLTGAEESVTANYRHSYFFEDFCILRVYAGETKGHPLVLMSILQRVMEEFLLSRFDITFTDNPDVTSIRVYPTFTYLRVHRQLFSFDRKIIPAFTDFDVYSISEVIRNLEDSSYFQVSKFIEPLSFQGLVECFLNLDEFMMSKSLSSIINPDKYFEKETVAVDAFIHRQWSFMRAEDYAFVKLVCKFIEDKETDTNVLRMFCKEFEALLNHKNYLIHFRAIYNVLEDDPRKQTLLRDHFLPNSSGARESLMTSHFDLADQTSIISFEKINSKHNFVFTESGPFRSGNIIWHTKFSTYGIILGAVLSSNSGDYYRVYTTKCSIECYRADSLVLVGSDAPKYRQILTFVLNFCEIDVLGLLYFNFINNVQTTPKFIMS